MHRQRVGHSELSHTVIRCAVGLWHQCLCTCICAEGGHFEHTL